MYTKMTYILSLLWLLQRCFPDIGDTARTHLKSFPILLVKHELLHVYMCICL